MTAKTAFKADHLTVARSWSVPGDPYKGIRFVDREVTIKSPGSRDRVTAPDGWSQLAIDMLATKYMRRAGVPVLTKRVAEDGVPKVLWRSVAEDPTHRFGEHDARQVFHRLAGCWAYWGVRQGHFGRVDPEVTAYAALAFYEEVCAMLAHQVFAPASPQWFNTGLHWAYGIEGPDVAQWSVASDPAANGVGVERSGPAYHRPAAGACFILSVKDDLVGEGGIYDAATREAKVFKFGGGAGGNFSRVRGEGEPLAGGGKSSGLLSFLKLLDSGAGAIKSGGTSRRAAKMVVLNGDHPDIFKFIWWKVGEEFKAASMHVGSHALIQSRSDMVAGGAAPDGVPELLRVRLGLAGRHGVQVPWPNKPLDLSLEGPCYQTVGGQNANNSVRFTNEFMQLAATGGAGKNWELKPRTGGAGEVVNAKALFDSVCEAAWWCADPGVQFDTTFNEWHTCPNDGRIDATNPCSEYAWLDDTACNLASVRLTAFHGNNDKASGFDFEAYRSACGIATVVLDITVGMSAYPSEAVAVGSMKYRTLGLGYADLGALLMRMGLAYDSPSGRAWCAALTSVMHMSATVTSAQMAAVVGAFPRFEANRDHVMRVVRNHAAFARRMATARPDSLGTNGRYEGLTIEPVPIDATLLPPEVQREVMVTAENAVASATRHGLRNAQLTLLAPTGTIGLVMDCDTFGIEPEFALVKTKFLVGGGKVEMVNGSVPAALARLGYTPADVEVAVAHVLKAGTMEGCPVVRPEHLAVFDCALPGGDGVRSIEAMGHVRMMAAAQPSLSGSISKTVNMPWDCSPADVREVYAGAWGMMVKAIALYPDGAKLNQPLNARARSAAAPERGKGFTVTETVASDAAFNAAVAGADLTVAIEVARAQRRLLPGRREGYTQKFKVGGHTFYLRTGEYPDGSLGEVFIDTAMEGAAFRAVGNALAIAVSLGLQYGVPLEEFVEAFVGMRFEPNGPVQGHDRIKMGSSFLDAIFRDLAIHYDRRDELAHVQAESRDTSGPSPLVAAMPGLEVAEAIDKAQTEAFRSGCPSPLDRKRYGVKGPRATGEFCPNCQNPSLQRTGSCKTCTSCGFNTGCG